MTEIHKKLGKTSGLAYFNLNTLTYYDFIKKEVGFFFHCIYNPQDRKRPHFLMSYPADQDH